MLSASRQGPLLCGKRQGEKKHNSRSRKPKGVQNLPSLLSDLEAEGMCLKALGLLPPPKKRPFYFQKMNQRAGNQLRDNGVGGRSSTVIHFSVAFCRQMYLCFFVYVPYKLKEKNECFGIVRLKVEGAAATTQSVGASQRRRGHQCHNKHLDPLPTSDAA